MAATPARPRASSKIEKYRKAALSTDSEQESFDNDDSEEEEEEEREEEGGSPSGGTGFMDVVHAAKGANSNSSWGKLKDKMPMLRRRHGIHSSISAPPPLSSLTDSISRKGGLDLFGDTDAKEAAMDSKQIKRRQVPRHMIGMET